MRTGQRQGVGSRRAVHTRWTSARNRRSCGSYPSASPTPGAPTTRPLRTGRGAYSSNRRRKTTDMETITSSTETPDAPPVLEMHDILQEFRVRGGTPLRALDDVSVAVHRGETLGIVGESGCGKSTL